MQNQENQQNAANEEKFQELLKRIEAVDVTAYEFLTPTNLKQAKTEFLANQELTQPNFIYGMLSEDFVDQNLMELEKINQEYCANLGSFSPFEQQVLDITWDWVHDKNAMLHWALMYQTAGSEQWQAKYKEQFRKVNQRLYGCPSQALFLQLLGWQMREVDQAVSRAMDVLKGKTSDAMRVLWTTPDEVWGRDECAEIGELALGASTIFAEAAALDYLTRDIVVPKVEQPVRQVEPEVFRKFRDFAEARMAHYLKYVPLQETFTPTEVCELLNAILAGEFAGQTEFKAELAEDRAQFSVNQLKRLIRVPTHRVNGDMTREELIAIVLYHEFGTHVIRGIPCEDSPIKMLSTGMPSYATFEEGLASCMEQVAMNRYCTAGEDHYVNIGLAELCGKNFREVFEMRWRINFINSWTPECSAVQTQSLRSKCRNAAFTQTMRCFRGTGEIVNMKDLMYFEGTRRVWEYITESLANDSVFVDDELSAAAQRLEQNLFGLGKIDPTRSEHLELVKAILA